LAVAWSGSALAQVRQVDTGGRALDRNTQVGSGGRNSTVNPQQYMNNAQLIASDQVSGLAGFRGATLVAPDQLRLTPPSTYLDRFMGQSVGVAQAAAGGTYATGGFYSPSRTVYATPRGSVATNTPAAYAAPGTASGSSAAIEQAYNDVRQRYDGVLPSAPSRTRGDDSPGQVSPSSLPPTIMDMSVTAASFTPEQRQREGLARELLEAQNALRAANVAGYENRSSPDLGGQKTLGAPDADEKELVLSTRGGYVIPRQNQDVFVDILMAMQKEREQATGVVRTKPGTPQGTNAGGAGEDDGSVVPDDSAAAADAAIAKADNPLVEVQNDRIVVHGLAGQAQDMFNKYMTRGQAGLKDGRYYEAARSFDMAAILNNTNPMATIGQGLAVFGAGEFYSAAQLFRRALETFPPIMETKLNMADMLKEGDLATQLKDLNERAASDEAETPLLFLAAFVNFNADDAKTARAFAARLVKREDAKPVVKTFAIYVQTGKIPKELPAEQPRPESKPQPAAKK